MLPFGWDLRSVCGLWCGVSSGWDQLLHTRQLLLLLLLSGRRNRPRTQTSNQCGLWCSKKGSPQFSRAPINCLKQQYSRKPSKLPSTNKTSRQSSASTRQCEGRESLNYHRASLFTFNLSHTSLRPATLETGLEPMTQRSTSTCSELDESLEREREKNKQQHI